MPIPAYPTADLPHKPLRRAFTRTRMDAVDVTSMESGPARQRRRDHTGMVRMTYELLLNEAQKALFDHFVNDTLAFGVKHFSMGIPFSNSVYSTRRVFIQGGAPAIEEMQEGAFWSVKFQLVAYPQGASFA